MRFSHDSRRCKNHKEIAKRHKLVCHSKSQDLKTFYHIRIDSAGWRHQMEAFLALLDLCEGNSPVTSEFPSQRPVTRNFDIFFDLRQNKLLSKPSTRRWFETPLRSLWRHCYGIIVIKFHAHFGDNPLATFKSYSLWFLLSRDSPSPSFPYKTKLAM